MIGILLQSAISLVAGVLVTYLGFFSPVFCRSSESLAPDPWVGAFRILARIAGPALLLVTGFSIYAHFRQEHTFQALDWREITSAEGRFRISSPAEFVKKVDDVPYGSGRVSESCFQVELPQQGFLVSYIDLPADMRSMDANKILNTELDENLQATGVKLLRRETTPFAGCPAVRFKLQNVAKGLFVDGILLLAKERRYQLAFQFTNESLAKNGGQFFDSFLLLGGP